MTCRQDDALRVKKASSVGLMSYISREKKKLMKLNQRFMPKPKLLYRRKLISRLAPCPRWHFFRKQVHGSSQRFLVLRIEKFIQDLEKWSEVGEESSKWAKIMIWENHFKIWYLRLLLRSRFVLLGKSILAASMRGSLSSNRVVDQQSSPVARMAEGPKAS